VTAPVSLEGLRVLLVEDEYFLAEEMADLLRKYGAEIVGPFARVQPALAAMRRDRVQAGLLDVRLDGETSERLAAVLVEDGVPVLLVTGYEPAQLPAGLRSLPSLRKPFAPGDLLQALESILDLPHDDRHFAGTEKQ
jgi:DNA-binding NtrC family response regulator